jgi:hypothetical protein
MPFIAKVLIALVLNQLVGYVVWAELKARSGGRMRAWFDEGERALPGGAAFAFVSVLTALWPLAVWIMIVSLSRSVSADVKALAADVERLQAENARLRGERT